MSKSSGILLVVLAATMSFAGVAVANEVAAEPEATMPAPLVVVDEEAGTVSIALPIDGELPECGEDGPDDGISTDEGAGYGPGDCIELVIEHPSGKTHHGAVVSTVAKELHPSMLDGIKKGEVMRWVAKAGKGDPDDEANDPKEPKQPGDDDKSNNGKSDEAKAKNESKHEDKPGNGNNPGNKDNPGNGGGHGNGRDNPGNGKGPKG